MKSIIIPYYNHWDLVHARLMELYKYAPNDCEIILVNDASTEPDCVAGAEWWMTVPSRHKIKYVKNDENVGFGASHNRGAELASGDILIFLSDDVIMNTDIITPIVATIREVPKSLVGGRMIYWPAGWNEFDFDEKHLVIPYCEGWLLACSKEVWHNLGGFDVDTFGKFDMEDVDLSMTALSLGYELMALNMPNNLLRHMGGTTIRGLNVDRMGITKKNKVNFIKKWEHEFPSIYDSLEQMSDGEQ